MSRFVTKFGGPYGFVGLSNSNDFHDFMLRNYPGLIPMGSVSNIFDSAVFLQCLNGELEIVIGDNARMQYRGNKNTYFIDNIGMNFKNNEHSPITIGNYSTDIDEIVYKYFKVINDNIKQHSVNEPVDSMTLIIPSEFSDNKRNELKKILKKAGFKVDQQIDESIAEYFGYLHHHNITPEFPETVLIVTVENNILKAKVLDVQYNGQYTFSLCNCSYDQNFNILDFNKKLSNEFLNTIDLTYDDLDINDQKETDRMMKNMFNHFCVSHDPFNDECSLEYAEMICDIHLTYDEYTVKLQNLIHQALNDIQGCVNASGKLKGQINRIIYSGAACMLPGLQEAVNQDFHKENQDLSKASEQDAIGGLIAASKQYSINDQLKCIGEINGKGLLKQLVPVSGNTRKASVKTKLPDTNKSYRLSLYEGYKGAPVNECTLVKNINIKAKYFDGKHRLEVERLSDGSVNVNIYLDNNVEECLSVRG